MNYCSGIRLWSACCIYIYTRFILICSARFRPLLYWSIVCMVSMYRGFNLVKSSYLIIPMCFSLHNKHLICHTKPWPYFNLYVLQCTFNKAKYWFCTIFWPTYKLYAFSQITVVPAWLAGSSRIVQMYSLHNNYLTVKCSCK